MSRSHTVFVDRHVIHNDATADWSGDAIGYSVGERVGGPDWAGLPTEVASDLLKFWARSASDPTLIRQVVNFDHNEIRMTCECFKGSCNVLDCSGSSA